MPFAFALAAFAGSRGCAPGAPPAAHATASLVAELGRAGLETTADDVAWVDPRVRGTLTSILHPVRAVVRAHTPGEPADLYLVRARLSPEGVLLDVVGRHPLTRTPGADEGTPVLAGDLVAYTTGADGFTTGVHLLDLAAEPRADVADLGRLGRAQNALTNLQECGQLSGIGRRAWSLDPSATRVTLAFDADALRVEADAHAIRLPLRGSEALEGGSFVRAHASEKARPGSLVTWAVDRVRALSWFGDDRMQTLKAFAFGLADRAKRLRGDVGADDTAHDIASDMGASALHDAPTYTDPETGWPPPPMKPLLSPALPGEGEWVALDRESFLATNPGVPSPFVSSYVRTDRERKYVRAYVMLWDPRQVELHMMAGTIEPVGATGEAGPGLIPRTPEIMRRVVGALNGGFQAMHGEFGMMGDGVVYLPPKPFAATVAALRDGSTAFGSWPREADIPDDMLSFRQNLTALVLDERPNPYGRTWWGGTPPGWKDKTHTVRTGICLTRERFVGYFYGNDIDADTLAEAMVQARCSFGIHLDMNSGHSGLELYRVAPAAELPPLGRPLQGDWEAEGAVPGLDGWKFRARRLVRGMGLMNFPRYIHREARDFFYLTLRHVLPGPPVAVAPGSDPTDGKWQTRGLPQHGFPFAVATTTVRADPAQPATRARVLAIDPHAVRVAGGDGAGDDAPTVAVLTGVARAATGEPAVWLGHGAFAIATEAPEGATQLFAGLRDGARAGLAARAAAGIQDEGGALVYVEPVDAAAPIDAGALDGLLARLGCSSRVLLREALHPALGGTTTLGGEPAPPAPATRATVRLVRGATPAGTRIFPDTPLAPPSVWLPLQSQRVRYFKKPSKSAPRPASSAPPDPSPPPEPGPGEVSPP